MENKNVKKSNRRAWFTVVTGFFVFFMIYGSALNCMGLFLVPMAEHFETSRGIISSLLMVSLLTVVPSSIIFGRIIDKIDLKIPMAICCAAVGVGYIIYAKAPSVPFLFVGAFVIGIGISGSIQIPVAVTINSWFVQKRGMAMGLAMVGSGVGGTILSQVLSRVIVRYDWSTAYLFLGLLVIATTVPLTLLFMTKSPESKGYLKYGQECAQAKSNTPSPSELSQNSVSIKEVLKRKEFWLLFVGLALLSLPMGAIKMHLVAYMSDSGYDTSVATNILTLAIIAVIPGKPLLGIFFDKFGAKFAVIVTGLCMTCGAFFTLGVSVSIAFAIVFGIFYGYGSAFSSVGTPLVLGAVIKTNANFATLLSISTMGASILAAIGTTVMGAVYDITGTYSTALLISSIAIGMGYFFVLMSVLISGKKGETRIKNN